MRRRLPLLLAAMVAGSTLVLFGPARPASTAIACAGNGTLVVNPGLFFPVLVSAAASGLTTNVVVDIVIGRPKILHGFTLNVPTGACVHVRPGVPTIAPAGGAGTLTGYCGHSSGVGTLNGERFAFVNAGTFVLFTGHLIAVATIGDFSLNQGQCLHFDGPTGGNPFALTTGPNTGFDIQFVGVGLNCTNSLPHTETLQRVPPTTVTVPLVRVRADHGVHAYTMLPCTNPDVLL